MDIEWNCASAGGVPWQDYDGLELAYCEEYGGCVEPVDIGPGDDVLRVMMDVTMVTIYGHLKDGGVEALHDWVRPFNVMEIREFAESLLTTHPQLTKHGVFDRTLF